MPVTKIERVRGTNDIMPEEYQLYADMRATLMQGFQAAGYRPIDVPLIEYTDLHLRKSGEAIVSRLYDFTHQNQRLCLRPEMTASITRAYVDQLQTAALPLRLCYAGPVFQYATPQEGSYRQFTQVGVELLGATGSLADSEMMALAAQGVERLGLTQYHLTIGHIGILAEFLRNLELDSRLQSFLLSHIDVLREAGREQVLQQLETFYAFTSRPTEAVASDLDEEDLPTEAISNLVDLLASSDKRLARSAILNFLRGSHIQIGGARDPEEIIERLLLKMKRTDQLARVHQALDFMAELGACHGPPVAVVQELARLLAAHGVPDTALQQVQATIEALSWYGIDPERMIFDAGMSRGIQYYTGVIFELYDAQGDTQRPICGGGRYDDLVALMGARQAVPAIGFAYGLEHIRRALGEPHAATARRADVLVIPSDAAGNRAAIQVAERLRQAGLRAEMDVSGGSIEQGWHYASQGQIPCVVRVDASDSAVTHVYLRMLATGAEQPMTLDEAIEAVTRMR
ncbi:MAG: ATP phosphoribosyltransferase regulatory subunit [Chloroflexaceae bacterium]|nr:ATP phosphoribosyltransferase regulatory subunit [Chloroflexaceae bacterium]